MQYKIVKKCKFPTSVYVLGDHCTVFFHIGKGGKELTPLSLHICRGLNIENPGRETEKSSTVETLNITVYPNLE